MSPVGSMSASLPEGRSWVSFPKSLVRVVFIVGLVLSVQNHFALESVHASGESAGEGRATVRLPVDVDGDGDTDQVGVPVDVPHKLVWFERKGDGSSFKRHVIETVDTAAADGERWMIEVRDLGHDGDKDLMVGAPGTSELSLHENVGAETGFRSRSSTPEPAKSDERSSRVSQAEQEASSPRTASRVTMNDHNSDCGTGQDAPDTFPGIDESNTTECFETQAGYGGLDQVNFSDDGDFYVFSASTGDNVSAVMDPSKGTCVDFDLYIYAANTTFSSINAGCQKDEISFLVSSGGNFVLEVDNWASDDSDYLLLECDGDCPPGGGGAGAAEECLIERAAPDAWTAFLRSLRDAFLLESAPGRTVTRTYYRWFGSSADFFG